MPPQGRATRDDQFTAELDGRAIASHLIASITVRPHKPTWLIIALTKTDLYLGDVDDVLRYYSQGSGSPFAAKVDGLRALAVGAKLSIDVLPV